MAKSAWTNRYSCHLSAKPIVFNRPQGKFSAYFFLFAFRGQTCEQKEYLQYCTGLVHDIRKVDIEV